MNQSQAADAAPTTRRSIRVLWIVLLVAAIALVMFGVGRSAWLCDDVYITLRTVDNWVHGFGLRWNIDERVQTYTHPLWLFVLTIPYYFTREPYYTTLAVCGVMTLAALIAMALLDARARIDAVLGVLVAGASHAFVDYSTSGLENSLTNLLIAIYLWLLLRAPRGARHLRWLALLASLLVLNRADYLLLVGPSLAYELWAQRSRRAVADLAIGLLPVVAWELFSFVYYGSLVPNTAYAKLNHGVRRALVFEQGWRWAMYTIRHDWPTAVTVAAAAVAAGFRKSWREIACVAGALLYVGYTIAIGGDFMGGRFWLAPFMLSLCFLVYCGVPATRATLVLTLASIIFLPLRTSTYGANPRESSAYEKGVWDERHSYFDTMGLVNVGWHAHGPLHPWARWGLREGKETSLTVRAAVGMHGYYGGPHLHIIDELALADPLLARLRPCPHPDLWVGHLRRVVPVGYYETLRDGRNEIEDPDVHAFYDHLRRVVSGPIWSARRFADAVRLSLGSYDSLLRAYDERLTHAHRSIPRFALFADEHQPLDCRECLTFYETAEISAAQPMVGATRCALVANHDRRYHIEFLRDGKLVGDVVVGSQNSGEGWSRYPFDVPRAVTTTGFDRVRLIALHGQTPFITGGIDCSLAPDREP